MTTKKAIANKLGMKYTTYLFRLKNGIPMDKPFNSKPGGNYKIDEALAKKIWDDLQSKSYLNNQAHIAAKHGVPKSIVSNMNIGKTWNHVTGLPKRVYEENLL